MNQVRYNQLKELQDQFTTEKKAKKRNSRFYSKWTSKVQGLIQDHNDFLENDLYLRADQLTTEYVNSCTDLTWHLEQFLNDIERAERTRNWTSSDWSSYSLVCQNVD